VATEAGEDETAGTTNGGAKGGMGGTSTAGTDSGGTETTKGGADLGGAGGEHDGGAGPRGPIGGAPVGGGGAGGQGDGGEGGAMGGSGGALGLGGGGEEGAIGGSGGEGGAGPRCTGVTMTQTASEATLHDHLGDAEDRALRSYINDDHRPASFTLVVTGPNGQTHTLTLTAQQIETLLAGGTVTGAKTGPAMNPATPAHTHTYTIKCA
jgi:hypothetical protein